MSLLLPTLAAPALFAPVLWAAEPAANTVQGGAASGWFDVKTGKQHLQGSVQVRINNADLSADEAESTAPDGQLSHARLKGSPARFRQEDPATGLLTEASAREIDYDVAGGRIVLRGEVQVQQRDPKKLLTTRVAAEEVAVVEKNNRAEELSATGQPASLTRQKDGEPPLSGAATRILYIASSQYVKLEGAAGLTRGQDTVEHDVIEHDGVNERTSTPRLDGKQMRFSRQPAPTTSGKKTDTAKPDLNQPDLNQPAPKKPDLKKDAP